MDKYHLIALLQRTIDALKNDDSVEGTVSYEVRPSELRPWQFNVEATIRVGNSEGHKDLIRVFDWPLDVNS